MKKKVVVTGANGFLGRYLCRYFADLGWEVVGLSRGGVELDGVRSVLWDGESLGDWADELEGAEVLVNLAGKSVNCRYGERNRDLIFATRLRSTEVLGEAIRGCEVAPSYWLNSSTATIYRHEEERANDEENGVIGEGFSVEVAKAWEKAFFDAEVPEKTKKVAMRTAIVFANEKGSVYDYLYGIAKLGLGGRMGSGKQKVSWIHIEDFCRAVRWITEQGAPASYYNLAAPNPTDNAGMMQGFRKAAGRKVGLPAARWMLEIGTWLMRSETELVLKSRWVVSKRLKEEGFEFRWGDFGGALVDLGEREGFRALV